MGLDWGLKESLYLSTFQGLRKVLQLSAHFNAFYDWIPVFKRFHSTIVFEMGVDIRSIVFIENTPP
jgi:hypothetical protein